MTYQELLKKIQARQFAAAYFFYGDEDFLMEDAVNRILSTMLDPAAKAFNRDILYGDEVDGAKVVNIASSYPMMANNRAVVVKEVNKLSQDSKELILRYLKHPAATTCLILTSPSIDEQAKFYSKLKELTEWVEFKPLYDSQIPEWIKSYMGSKGKKIFPGAVRLLHGKVGVVLRDLVNEIEKLLLFVDDKERIEEEDVEAVVGIAKHYNIFELSDAVGKMDLKGAVEILERMLDVGESPVSIVAMLTRYFTILWKIKELIQHREPERKIASIVGVHPFFVKDYIAQAQNFSEARITTAFTHLLNADVHLKSSYQKPKIVMDVLIYNLIRGNIS